MATEPQGLPLDAVAAAVLPSRGAEAAAKNQVADRFYNGLGDLLVKRIEQEMAKMAQPADMPRRSPLELLLEYEAQEQLLERVRHRGAAPAKGGSEEASTATVLRALADSLGTLMKAVVEQRDQQQVQALRQELAELKRTLEQQQGGGPVQQALAQIGLQVLQGQQQRDPVQELLEWKQRVDTMFPAPAKKDNVISLEQWKVEKEIELADKQEQRELERERLALEREKLQANRQQQLIQTLIQTVGPQVGQWAQGTPPAPGAAPPPPGQQIGLTPYECSACQFRWAQADPTPPTVCPRCAQPLTPTPAAAPPPPAAASSESDPYAGWPALDEVGGY